MNNLFCLVGKELRCARAVIAPVVLPVLELLLLLAWSGSPGSGVAANKEEACGE